MPKGYWIVRLDVTDKEQYKKYVAVAPAVVEQFGGRFIVRAGRFEVPEGVARSRNIVVEFSSYQAALDCWHSPAYQQAIALRQPATTIDLVIVEGFDS
jgi:uncharacterized protein (DUF1330 family)